MKVLSSGAVPEEMIIDTFVQREHPQKRLENWLKERGEILDWVIHEPMLDKVKINPLGVLEISASIQNKAIFTKRTFSSGKLYFEFNITCYSKQRVMFGVGISSQTSSRSWPYDTREYEKIKIGLLLDFENAQVDAFDPHGNVIMDDTKIGNFRLSSSGSLFIKTLGRADVFLVRKPLKYFNQRQFELNAGSNNDQLLFNRQINPNNNLNQ